MTSLWPGDLGWEGDGRSAGALADTLAVLGEGLVDPPPSHWGGGGELAPLGPHCLEETDQVGGAWVCIRKGGTLYRPSRV